MTRVERGTLTIRADGRLLIGGNAPRNPDVDDGTARLGDAPYIPASALKGAVRETFTRLLRAVAPDKVCAPACPEQGLEEGEEGGEGCLVCALFGAPGHSRPARLRLGDGHLRHTENVKGLLEVDHRVSVRRTTRTQMPGRLFNREVAGRDPQCNVYVADVEAIFDDQPVTIGDREVSEKDIISGAVAATLGLGGGRSTGLGRVSLSLDLEPTGDSGKPSEIAGETVMVTASPEAPICVGPPQRQVGNFLRTLDHIPGSTLRGAVAQALLDAGVSDDAAEFKAAFLQHETGASFGPLLPRPEGSELPVVPMPQSALRCKVGSATEAPEDHPLRDTLLAGILASWLQRDDRQPRVNLRCEVCAARGGGRMERAAGYLLGWGEQAAAYTPPTRVMTRTALDRATGGVLHGNLYSQEELLPGAPGARDAGRAWELTGAVTGLPGALVSQIQRAGGRAHLGRGRGRGLGRSFLSLAAGQPYGMGVEERLALFRRAVMTRWEAAGQPGDPPELLAVLLVSPLPLTEGLQAGDHLCSLLAQALPGVRRTPELAWLRSVRVGRYLAMPPDAAKKHGVETDHRQQGLCTAAAPGSVVVVRLEAPPSAEELSELDRLERRGLPLSAPQRQVGLGRVCFCHPFHAKNAPAGG